MAILKNLFGYSDKSIEEITIKEIKYLADLDSLPRYIVGQAFGAGYDEDSYNQKLARSVIAAREFFNSDIPAIVQQEIVLCLQRIDETNEIHGIGEVYAEGEKSRVLSKLNTRQVMEEANRILIREDLKHYHALFVAHPYHMQRVLDRGREFEIIGSPFMRKEIEWPSNDPQPWVRSPWLFVPRELAARILKK